MVVPSKGYISREITKLDRLIKRTSCPSAMVIFDEHDAGNFFAWKGSLLKEAGRSTFWFRQYLEYLFEVAAGHATVGRALAENKDRGDRRARSQETITSQRPSRGDRSASASRARSRSRGPSRSRYPSSSDDEHFSDSPAPSAHTMGTAISRSTSATSLSSHNFSAPPPKTAPTTSASASRARSRSRGPSRSRYPSSSDDEHFSDSPAPSAHTMGTAISRSTSATSLSSHNFSAPPPKTAPTTLPVPPELVGLYDTALFQLVKVSVSQRVWAILKNYTGNGDQFVRRIVKKFGRYTPLRALRLLTEDQVQVHGSQSFQQVYNTQIELKYGAMALPQEQFECVLMLVKFAPRLRDEVVYHLEDNQLAWTMYNVCQYMDRREPPRQQYQYQQPKAPSHPYQGYSGSQYSGSQCQGSPYGSQYSQPDPAPPARPQGKRAISIRSFGRRSCKNQ
ncbi:hypothetical protein DICA4_D19042 [Diutina catenulata]